jgi:hypothetical protein
LKIIADTPCSGGSGCFIPAQQAIKLGRDETGAQLIFKKFVVGHELGHFVASRQFGSISSNYSLNSTLPICGCAHVTSEADRSHCLQSQEGISAAQSEGYAHFIATAILNGTESSGDFRCRFNYYKQFGWFPGPSAPEPAFVQEPPVAIDCEFPMLWLANNCPAAERGTEIDWLIFYWNLMRVGGLSWTELTNMYISSCDNARCNGDAVTWTRLVNGAPSSKRAWMRDLGFSCGVDF